MDLVEPSGGDEEFEGGEDEDGEDVEGGLVGEDGVSFYAFEGQDGMAELDLGCGGGDDGAKCAGEH